MSNCLNSHASTYQTMALGKRLAAREFQSLLLEILQMGEKEKKKETQHKSRRSTSLKLHPG